MTLLSSLAVLSFLAQPMILAHAPRALVTAVEGWGLVLVSALTGWVFVAGGAEAHYGAAAITGELVGLRAAAFSRRLFPA